MSDRVVIAVVIFVILLNLYLYNIGTQSGEVTFWILLAQLTAVYSAKLLSDLDECRQTIVQVK